MGIIYKFIYKAFVFLNCNLRQVDNKITFIFNKTSKEYLNLDFLYEYFYSKSNNAILVKIQSNRNCLNKIWWISQSKIIFVDQADRIISRLTLDKKTKLIQVWHAGGAYKAFGFDAMRHYEDQAKELSRISRIHGQYSNVIISDAKLIDIMTKAYNIQSDKLLPLGLPRTDMFFKLKNKKQIKNEIKNSFKLKEKTKIILYCPTFRTSNNKRNINLNYLNIVQNSTKKVFQNSVILYRDHPSVIRDGYAYGDGIIDVSRYTNITDLFIISDFLITDYSSIIFDYSFFKKPIILFTPDIDTYVIENRKLYFQPEELVGKNMVAKDFNTLTQCILNAEYTGKLWDNFMGGCDGQVCEKIYDYFCKN
ncbi:CDP-glycerol glycerophosphotransferase family protein [Campylobacter aviculae]|uniref:CDP-glycerol--glycerophosphate glycerophosphotransferase n=1 Tax=Campylobacter aviculae TaxID=2510190 RepID=A0A4U7BJW5_9BACT|nr:CDP-glycerol glycerophosphotransferase family protein [Campylobacter aviculae]TKX32193.1 hypothetical protein CQA76_04700 [Campylobacter aviculae]